MISVAEAISLVKATAQRQGAEEIHLDEALGRVLAASVSSPIDLPPFTCSAVDGYAVRSDDFRGSESRLKVIGRVAAGEHSEVAVKSGVAVRIFTGSALPAGADAVVMQEETQVLGDEVLISASVREGSHVRFRGEELREGTKVFEPGVVLTPSVVGALANMGLSTVSVYRRPRVGVLSTGSELAPLGGDLKPGQIFASNAVAIASALKCLGADLGDVRVVDDAPQSVFTALSEMLPVHDCIVTCGGVSVGDHDLVRDEAMAAGVREVFWKVAMKPGKPFFLGVTPDNKPVYGLPGNPVSALVCFHILARPGIMKMMGVATEEGVSPARLGADIRKQRGRTEFVRARVESCSGDLVAMPLDLQGSHMGTGLAHANCLILAEAERESYGEGETVGILLLKWGLV